MMTWIAEGRDSEGITHALHRGMKLDVSFLRADRRTKGKLTNGCTEVVVNGLV